MVEEAIAQVKGFKELYQQFEDKVLLALIYSAGLRVGEASRLRLSDIDSGRMMIHIRQSKYAKDRYIPLSPFVLKGLQRYCTAYHPVDYLFNGSRRDTPLSIPGIQYVVREAVKKCGLLKGIYNQSS